MCKVMYGSPLPRKFLQMDVGLWSKDMEVSPNAADRGWYFLYFVLLCYECRSKVWICVGGTFDEIYLIDDIIKLFIRIFFCLIEFF